MADDEASLPEGVRLPSLAVSDALRATFSLYRRHFWTFALVMGVLAVPSTLLASMSDWIAMQILPPGLRDPLSVAGLSDRLLEVGLRLLNLAVWVLLPTLLWTLPLGATILVAAHLLRGHWTGVGEAY